MNYQIIGDEEALKHFVEWLPELKESETFLVSLFARKKYSNGAIKSNNQTQLRRFTSKKHRLIEKIRQLEIPVGAWKMKDEAAPQEALALYITLNPRCMRKATELMGKKCWDLMNSENYNLQSEALSCIQKSKSRTVYVDFDIDDKDINLDEDWLDTEIVKGNYTIVETRGGFHVLVEPNQASAFRKETYNDDKWYQLIQEKYPVDQAGDQLIPVVGSFQGGFVPKII